MATVPTPNGRDHPHEGDGTLQADCNRASFNITVPDVLGKVHTDLGLD